MTPIPNRWICLILGIFMFGLSQGQNHTAFDVLAPNRLPSQYELALVFANAQYNQSIDYVRLCSFENGKGIASFELIGNSLEGNVRQSVGKRSWPNSFTKRSFFEESRISEMEKDGFKTKPYLPYYMPTYTELNVTLSKSRQVLNSLLTLGSSLYVTSLQNKE